MSDTETLVLLRQVNFLHAVDDAVLAKLQEKLTLESFAEGQALCFEGEAGDRMFVVEQGRVAVEKKGEGGQPVRIAELRPGEIAGEMSLLGQMRRSATLRAEGSVTAWCLKYEHFQEILDSHPSLAQTILASLSRHLSRQSSTVARLLSRGLDYRFKIACFDCEAHLRAALQKRNRYDYAFGFFVDGLNDTTVSLAAGYDAVCVGDPRGLSDAVLEELKGLNVGVLVIREGNDETIRERGESFGIEVAVMDSDASQAVAEHAVALMLSLGRKIMQGAARVREGNFATDGLLGCSLQGSTAGVIGCGRVGQRVLEILKGFGCELLAHSLSPSVEISQRCGVSFVPLEELMSRSDIVSLHLPYGEETHHWLDAGVIEMMKPGAMLIHTAPLGLIDTEALLGGLQSGRIGAFAMDLRDRPEPYAETLSRLSGRRNVLITNHQAALTEADLGAKADRLISRLREYEMNSVSPRRPG